VTSSAVVDWDKLRTVARDAMSRAYAPYSDYPVGAAALVDDGRIVSGCNVENASYGLGLCAECGLVSELQNTGGGRLTHFTCVDGRGEILVPCGRCRQLLYEFGGPDLLLETPAGLRPLSAMLPQPFGPDHLATSPRPGPS
jgi:cytidine deaminase